MDRQKEFVLRTLEERDIRFVRLWFTDVLGYLKSVAIAPAELEALLDRADAELDPEFAEKWFNFVVAEVIRHHTAAAGNH